MPFTPKQVEQLLKPIHRSRVLELRGHSHLSEQDVQAHLIRMFGFGGYDTEVLQAECLYAVPTIITPKGKDKPDPNRWDACYRVLMRLTVKDEDGNVVQRIEDGSTGEAQNQTRGDAHDLAYKSAISLSMKRCAKGLGDQFGLSLYNKGQRSALVIDTLVGREPSVAAEAEDVQASVPQQVADGSDESEGAPTAAGPAPGDNVAEDPNQYPGPPEEESEPSVQDKNSLPLAGGGGLTVGQSKAMHKGFNDLGYKDDHDRQLQIIAEATGNIVESTKAISRQEASLVLDKLRELWREQTRTGTKA